LLSSFFVIILSVMARYKRYKRRSFRKRGVRKNYGGGDNGGLSFTRAATAWQIDAFQGPEAVPKTRNPVVMGRILNSIFGGWLAAPAGHSGYVIGTDDAVRGYAVAAYAQAMRAAALLVNNSDLAEFEMMAGDFVLDKARGPLSARADLLSVGGLSGAGQRQWDDARADFRKKMSGLAVAAGFPSKAAIDHLEAQAIGMALTISPYSGGPAAAHVLAANSLSGAAAGPGALPANMAVFKRVSRFLYPGGVPTDMSSGASAFMIR
jgi:hypothetical protein